MYVCCNRKFQEQFCFGTCLINLCSFGVSWLPTLQNHPKLNNFLPHIILLITKFSYQIHLQTCDRRQTQCLFYICCHCWYCANIIHFSAGIKLWSDHPFERHVKLLLGLWSTDQVTRPPERRGAFNTLRGETEHSGNSRIAIIIAIHMQIGRAY